MDNPERECWVCKKLFTHHPYRDAMTIHDYCTKECWTEMMGGPCNPEERFTERDANDTRRD